MGLYLLVSRLVFFFTASRAAGQIVGFKEVPGSKGRVYFYPIVEFETPDGIRHTIVAAAGSTGRPRENHSVLTVLYDAQRPEKGMVHSFMHYWMAPIAFLILAGGISLVFLQP